MNNLSILSTEKKIIKLLTYKYATRNLATKVWVFINKNVVILLNWLQNNVKQLLNDSFSYPN